MASVLTNDPKQRPMFNFVSTIFSWCTDPFEQCRNIQHLAKI